MGNGTDSEKPEPGDGSPDGPKPTYEQLRVLRRMRQGQRLAVAKGKYEVAELDEYYQVDMSLVAELEEAGWIYPLDTERGRTVWQLSWKGIELLESWS